MEKTLNKVTLRQLRDEEFVYNLPIYSNDELCLEDIYYFLGIPTPCNEVQEDMAEEILMRTQQEDNLRKALGDCFEYLTEIKPSESEETNEFVDLYIATEDLLQSLKD